MKPFAELKRLGVQHDMFGWPDPDEGGAFMLGNLRIVATWQLGWDHVSVSLPDRCPTWDEMEKVKRTFFKQDEVAMQLHVPPTDHVNFHPYCLHLWRPQNAEIPRPHKDLVGGL